MMLLLSDSIGIAIIDIIAIRLRIFIQAFILVALFTWLSAKHKVELVLQMFTKNL